MSDQFRNRPRTAAPTSVEEAMQRARQHSRAALSETLAAAQALLDAASLATRGEPAESHRALGSLSRALEEASSQLSQDTGRLAGPVVEAILDALDSEIARWEERSAEDTEARAVLRAFLGLREILWEFGMRRDEASPSATSNSGRRRTRAAAGTAARTQPRVQRVRVQG